MKILSKNESDRYLHTIGMKIGEWNKITYLNKNNHSNFFKLQAPKIARDLLQFSHHIAGWLPKGNWKFLQIDNSGGLQIDELVVFCKLISSECKTLNLAQQNSFLFEFGFDSFLDQETELLISYIIYFFLHFESHCHLVSSSSDSGEILRIQDGFVYFCSDEKRLLKAHEIIENFQQNKTLPDWVAKIVIDNQFGMFKSD